MHRLMRGIDLLLLLLSQAAAQLGVTGEEGVVRPHPVFSIEGAWSHTTL
jgi:hypothetical protein